MAIQVRKLSRLWPVPAVLALWAGLSLSGLLSQMIDFQVNYKAAKRLQGAETLYPGSALDGHYEFKYPPCAAALYVPLTLLPQSTAKILWALIVLSASAASIWLSLKLSRMSSNLPWFLSVLPGLVLARFFLRELQLGQVNGLVAFLMLAMVSLLIEPRARLSPGASETLAGLTWGLATAVKIYPLIFLPYFLMRKKWKALASGAGVLAAGFLLPSVFYGFSANAIVHGEWLSTLSRSTPHLFSSQDNISLLAALFKATGHLRVALILWMLAAALLGAVLLVVMSRAESVSRPMILESGALMLLIPMISPLGWDYTFLLSLLGLTLCFRHFLAIPRLEQWLLGVNAALISLTLYDILGRRAYARFMSLSLLTMFFLIIFGILASLRWKRLA